MDQPTRRAAPAVVGGDSALSGSQSVRPATTSTYTLTVLDGGRVGLGVRDRDRQAPYRATASSGEPHPALVSLAGNRHGISAPIPAPRPGDQPCEAITDYSRFTYDPVGHRMLMFGGGHATTFRDDVDVLSLSAGSTLRWTSAYTPTPCADMTAGNFDATNGEWVTTGHPLARHSYDMLVWSAVTNELILLPSISGRGGCTQVDSNAGGRFTTTSRTARRGGGGRRRGRGLSRRRRSTIRSRGRSSWWGTTRMSGTCRCGCTTR